MNKIFLNTNNGMEILSNIHYCFILYYYKLIIIFKIIKLIIYIVFTNKTKFVHNIKTFKFQWMVVLGVSMGYLYEATQSMNLKMPKF